MRRTTPLLSVALLLLACVLAAIAVRNAWAWARCIRSGRIEGTYSRPLYGPLNVPANAAYGAGGKLAGDYASLFFSAKDFIARSQMYDPKADPSGRPAVTFPPLLIFLTAFTIGRFEFSTSAIVSNLAQIGLFLIATAYFFRGGPASPGARLVGFAASVFLTLCTPVGTTWFERGQTDLYCASANLLLLKAMRDNRFGDFALAGLVASLKWSCFPFFAMAALPYLALSPGFDVATRRLGQLALLAGVVLLTLVVFGANALNYVKLVYRSEAFNAPTGISLSSYFPQTVSKMLPFCVPVAFIIFSKLSEDHSRALTSIAEPTLWATAALVSAAFGTVAYEYRLVSSLFLLPLAIDARAILSSRSTRSYSMAGRTIAVLFLWYGFRVETTRIVDTALSDGRALVPLATGLIMLIGLSAAALMRRTAPDEPLAG